MSSDEDYYPPFESPSDLRRSERLLRSATKPKRAKKIEEKPKKKTAPKRKTTPAKKSKASPKNENASLVYNGPELTNEELRQLWLKYTRDGHFRLNPSNSSPAPLVVSRTTDGNVVTTKIECYKQKKYLMRELAATITSPKTNNDERALLEGSDDSSAVIFSNPIADTSGRALNLNVSSGPYLSAQDTNKGTKNCSKMKQGPAPNADGTSDPGNGLPQNRSNSNMQPKFSSTVFDSPANIPVIPSSSSAFIFVAPAQSPTTRDSHIFRRPNSSTRQANASVENQNSSTTSGLLFPRNNSQNGYDGSVANGFNSNNSNEGPSGNHNPSNSQTISNQYNNSTSLNSQNSAFSVQNQSSTGNTFNNWNSAIPMNSNTFVANNATINGLPNNLINRLPNNSMNFIPTNIVAYNTGIKNVNNSYAGPAISNGLISDGRNTSGYSSSSSMSWDGMQVFPNNYLTGGNYSYCNMYGVQNSAGVYDASGTGIVNNSSNQLNSWSQNQQLNKGFFLTNGNNGNGSSTMTNLMNNGIGQTISNFPTITNIDNNLTLPNGEQPAKGPFLLEDFHNDEDNGFDPNTASACPYDDDISYENYTDENLDCKDENADTATQNDEPFTNFLMNVKKEVRSLYDGGNNYSQIYNNSSMDLAGSVFYDFDTKKEITDSSDCIIIDTPSRC